jgi:hypothetical protein
MKITGDTAEACVDGKFYGALKYKPSSEVDEIGLYSFKSNVKFDCFRLTTQNSVCIEEYISTCKRGFKGGYHEEFDCPSKRNTSKHTINHLRYDYFTDSPTCIKSR